MLDTSIKFDFDDFTDLEVLVLTAAAIRCAEIMDKGSVPHVRQLFSDLFMIAQVEHQRRGHGTWRDWERRADTAFLKDLGIEDSEE